MPSAIISRHLRANMSAVYHPILTWGRCSHTWGHGRPGCSPTWGHSDSACTPNVAPPPPVHGLPYILLAPTLYARARSAGWAHAGASAAAG